MEDMASALGSILNNPEAMQQIMGLASQLGLSGPGSGGGEGGTPFGAAAPAGNFQQSPPPPFGAPNPLETAQSTPEAGTPPLADSPLPSGSPPPTGAGGLDLAALMKVTQMMGSVSQKDSNAELLLALKPHFGEKRQKKVDDAVRIMQLIRVLPLLRESGIFGNLFGGDT